MIQQQLQKAKSVMAAGISAISFNTLVLLFILILNFFFSEKIMAQTSGDYRSISTGAWSDKTIWQKFNGTSWVSATSAPSSTQGVITIQSGHTVTVTANVTVDQVMVSAGSTLTLGAVALTVANGAGPDLEISGTLNMSAGSLTINTSAQVVISGTMNMNTGSPAINAGGQVVISGTMNMNAGGLTINTGGQVAISGTMNKNAGSLTINTSAQVAISNGGTYNFNGGTQSATGWTVNNGGTYVHNVNGITIPTAIWGPSSTLKITGVTSSNVTGTYQDFGNVIFDCPNANGYPREFTDDLKSIAGDFTVLRTGVYGIWLQKNTTATPVTISGNYLQSGGIVHMGSSANFSWNVMGNFTLVSGTFYQTDSSGSVTLNVHGTFSIAGGNFSHCNSSSIAGTGTVNLYGNYIMTGGVQAGSSSLPSCGIVNFSASGTQSFIRSAGLMANQMSFTVKGGATLDLANYIIPGGGIFTVEAGGGLIIGSTNGITLSGSSGNVQISGVRSFSTGGNYTYAGTTAQVTGNGLPGTVNNLTFNNPNNVTLTSNVSITNILSLMAGKVITNNRTLHLSNPGPLNMINYSSSNYVVGNLRRAVNANGAYDFPVGTMSNYELANVNLTDITGFTSLLGFFTNASPIAPGYPLTNVYVGTTEITDMLNYGYWTLTPNSSMMSGTYAVTLNEKGHTNPADPNQYCVLKRDNNTSPWQSIGYHDNSTQSEIGGVATAVRSSLSSFSDFGIGKAGAGPMPVTLTFFTAKGKSEDEKTVLVSWTTVAEENNDYFTIQRSKDGKIFSDITCVNGAGNSTALHEYSFIDENPLDGTSYYRLRQTDFNGRTETFKPVSVTIKGKENINNIISVFPNPFPDSFTAQFECEEKEEVSINILSAKGALVFSEKIITEAGNNTYQFTNPAGFREGTYLVKVTSAKTVIATGIIVCRK